MVRKHSEEELREAVSRFQVYGDVTSVTPYGTGHINDTYLATVNLAGKRVHYILQGINTQIFTHPVSLMKNIERVTHHLHQKLQDARDADSSRKTLTIIRCKDGSNAYSTKDGKCWRMYLFIEQAQTFDVISSPQEAFSAAKAFANFQNQLADLPAPRLEETIPAFHNIRSRLCLLDEACKRDVAGRLREVGPELDFVNARRTECTRLLDQQAAGEIPERITHNDTKINNVMFDNKTNAGICVIDLDTVMPGLALYDFGDMVRTATASAAEDETDLSKVASRLDMFQSLVKGYCSQAGFLTKAEKEDLAFSGRLITFTIGVRFLTDYLSGDVYFKTRREKHNLDRARNQFKMVLSQEAQAKEREAFIRSC